MSTFDASYFTDNPTEFDKLAEADQERVLNGGFVSLAEAQDVTSAPSDAEPESNAEPKAEVVEDNDEPVIAQKSGKGVIPYSALEEARMQAQQWKLIAEQKDALLAQLEAAKAQDAGTGATQAQDAVIEEYASEYPEVAEDLKPLIQQMIAQGVKDALDKVTQQVEQRVAPVEQQVVKQLQSENDQAILAVHADIIDVSHTPEFAKWMQETPYVLDRQSKQPLNVAQVWQEFKSPQVNELLSQFKASRESPTPPPPDKSAETKAKAQEKLANVKTQAPGTFSDIPSAGVKDASSEAERFLAMSPAELERAMLTMTEAQRNDLFARLA
jgi:hypothetical protein